MTSQVRVVRLDEEVEEEALVDVGGHLLTCFVSACPFAIASGGTYPATLSLWAVDDLELREASDEPTGITRIGSGFRHRVVGALRGSVLDAGICFEDELFATEYGYLDGRRVVVEVDRIQLAFGEPWPSSRGRRACTMEP